MRQINFVRKRASQLTRESRKVTSVLSVKEALPLGDAFVARDT